MLRPRLKAFIRDKIVRRLLPTEVVFGPNRNDREGALHRSWGHVFTSQIKGAYYEFGVYRGDTFRASYRVYQDYSRWAQSQLSSPEPWRSRGFADYAGYCHQFYAFDTFQGIPENDEENITFAEGAFSCSLEEFTRLNRANGMVEDEQIRYFAGKFSEVNKTMTKELDQLQPAAIVNLDSDLYFSARDALAVVAPRLVQGSILLVDDWNAFAAARSSGERRAVAEFLTEHPEISLESWFPYHYSGQAFLVHRH